MVEGGVREEEVSLTFNILSPATAASSPTSTSSVYSGVDVGDVDVDVFKPHTAKHRCL